MKKLFILSILFIIYHGLSTENVYAFEPITFYERFLYDSDISFHTVTIRDSHDTDSPFFEEQTISSEAVVGQMFRVLGDIQLMRVEDAQYYTRTLRQSHRVYLDFAGTRDVPQGFHHMHQHRSMRVVVFPNEGILSLSGWQTFGGASRAASYFYYDELDLERLLTINPVHLLTLEVVIVFLVLVLIVFLLLRYWLGTPTQKEFYPRNYIISVWLTLFFMAFLMGSSFPPIILTLATRVGFLVFSLTILIHSKRHGLTKILIWELIGIGLSLALAFTLSSTAMEGFASILRWVMSGAIIVAALGAFIYMLAYGKS